MAHQRSRSSISGSSGGAHSISLKVLRLSRPSLATQTPLPPTNFGNGLDIAPGASHAYPIPSADASSTSTFPLSPLLTLPAAFGAAYVGETFTCALCANNEIAVDDETKSVHGVRLIAELQTPSRQEGIALTLDKGYGADSHEEEGEIAPSNTLQRLLKHELKEEGPHVLAVTVTYTETLRSGEGNGASGGRARTFRKLYQFVAQPLLAVRSKVTERKKVGVQRQWILEAQLENVGEMSVVLEKLSLSEKPGFVSAAMNGGAKENATVLKPQDIEQVMFVLRAEEAEMDGREEESPGRLPLAQLNVNWRSAMGEPGNLTTAWLAARAR